MGGGSGTECAAVRPRLAARVRQRGRIAARGAHAPPHPPPLPRSKDESSTQATLGFRICGVKVARADGREWRADRHWGKRLGRADALDALRRFADNGVCFQEGAESRGGCGRRGRRWGRPARVRQGCRVSSASKSQPLPLNPPRRCAGALAPADVLAPLAAELRALAAAVAASDAFHVFSASALLAYDGAATDADGARPRVALIDFAHAFPRGAHGGGPDANLLAGLAGLAAAIDEVLAGGGGARGGGPQPQQ
jgi:hypothetical protein